MNHTIDMENLLSFLRNRTNYWLYSAVLILWLLPKSIAYFHLDYWVPFEIGLRLKALPEPLTLLQLSGLLVANYLWGFSLFRSYSKKPNKRNFIPINPPGLYKSKIDGLHYCQYCMDKDQKEIRPTRINTSGFVCRICSQKYELSWNYLRSCPEEENELDRAMEEFKKK